MTTDGRVTTNSRTFSYRIEKELAVIGRFGDETKELNLISFNSRPAKLDLRCWKNEDGKRLMLKGVTLSKDEAFALKEALDSLFDVKGTH